MRSTVVCSLALCVLATAAVGEAGRANPANNGTPWTGELGGGNCPPGSVIGAVPFNDTGDTCLSTNTIDGWGGAGACTLPAGPGFYQGEDVAYQFTVGAGNSLTFDLPTFNGDLVLAIFSVCDDGNTCEAHSGDSIGPGTLPETIGPISFTSGTTHFLYVDSYYAAGNQNSCGTYTLNVTGTLPAELIEFGVD